VFEKIKRRCCGLTFFVSCATIAQIKHKRYEEKNVCIHFCYREPSFAERRYKSCILKSLGAAHRLYLPGIKAAMGVPIIASGYQQSART